MKSLRMSSVFSRLIPAVLVIMAFLAGFVVRGFTPESPLSRVAAQDEEAAFPLLTEAAGYVDEFYVKDQPDDTAIEYAILRAYLGALGDPYTFFIEPAVAASESQALAGRYGGVGAEVRRNESGDFVLYPFAGSPAEREGLREGDILLAINGTPLDLSASVDMVRQALRGEIVEGAGVTLRVRNQEDGAERELFIPFEEILVPSLTWRTVFEAPEIGYINILSFTSRTPEEFAQAITELRAAGIQALVVDLRDNSGGLLQESVEITGEFLDGGVISSERRVTGETVLEDPTGGLMLDLPLVVLVNGRTASASEILAGAIQARGRGILIGQTTYGKGSIQRIFPLTDGSSIHVTTAIWLTPANQPLDGIGLTPDITMIPDENGRDVELGEAVRYLRSQLGQGE